MYLSHSAARPFETDLFIQNHLCSLYCMSISCFHLGAKVGDLHYILENPLRALQPRSSVGHHAVLRVRARLLRVLACLSTCLIHIAQLHILKIVSIFEQIEVCRYVLPCAIIQSLDSSGWRALNLTLLFTARFLRLRLSLANSSLVT